MSITLTNSVTVTSGGQTLENDTVAGVASYQVDCSQIPTFTATIQLGTGLIGSAIHTGVYPTPIQLSVDLSSGAWKTTNGKSGKLDVPSLATFVTSLQTLRNTVESFVVANTIVTGAQVPW